MGRDDRLSPFFFWLGAAWVKSRAERPSVSGVNRKDDRLSPSCTEAGERERKHAVDRVGRNDRLDRGEEKGRSQGPSGPE